MYRTGARRLAALLIGGVLPASPSAWSAPPAAYPQRPITLVVGYAPGGSTDTLARLIARSMSRDLGQSVVVENKSGASSNFGAESVARSAADGHTLYVATIANAINRTLYPKLNYDLIKDFTPVARIASVTNVLVVNNALPIASVQEYVAYARQNPGKLTCASSGIGSSIHLSCELFKIQTGADILHVPYRGGGPALAAVLGGQVDSMFDNVPTSLPHIRAGRLRALGVTAAAPTSFAPDIPPIKDAGLNDFNVESWFGLMAPAGTPPETVARLNQSLNRALASVELREAYSEQGYTAPVGENSPESFARFVSAEVDKWGAVVRATDLKAQ